MVLQWYMWIDLHQQCRLLPLVCFAKWLCLKCCYCCCCCFALLNDPWLSSFEYFYLKWHFVYREVYSWLLSIVGRDIITSVKLLVTYRKYALQVLVWAYMACSDLHWKISNKYLYVIHIGCSSTSLRNVYFCCLLLLFLSVDYALLASSLVKYFWSATCFDFTTYLINWFVVLVLVNVGILPQMDLILSLKNIPTCCQGRWVLIFILLILQCSLCLFFQG